MCTLTIIHVIEPLVRVLGAGPRHGLQATVLPGEGGAAHKVFSRGQAPIEAAAVSRALTPTTLGRQTMYENPRDEINFKHASLSGPEA